MKQFLEQTAIGGLIAVFLTVIAIAFWCLYSIIVLHYQFQEKRVETKDGVGTSFDAENNQVKVILDGSNAIRIYFIEDVKLIE